MVTQFLNTGESVNFLHVGLVQVAVEPLHRAWPSGHYE